MYLFFSFKNKSIFQEANLTFLGIFRLTGSNPKAVPQWWYQARRRHLHGRQSYPTASGRTPTSWRRYNHASRNQDSCRTFLADMPGPDLPSARSPGACLDHPRTWHPRSDPRTWDRWGTLDETLISPSPCHKQHEPSDHHSHFSCRSMESANIQCLHFFIFHL